MSDTNFQERDRLRAEIADLKAKLAAAYSVEQIKAAYWRCFHKSGEYWFEEFGSERDCTEATESLWGEFVKALGESLP